MCPEEVCAPTYNSILRYYIILHYCLLSKSADNPPFFLHLPSLSLFLVSSCNYTRLRMDYIFYWQQSTVETFYPPFLVGKYQQKLLLEQVDIERPAILTLAWWGARSKLRQGAWTPVILASSSRLSTVSCITACHWSHNVIASFVARVRDCFKLATLKTVSK